MPAKIGGARSARCVMRCMLAFVLLSILSRWGYSWTREAATTTATTTATTVGSSHLPPVACLSPSQQVIEPYCSAARRSGFSTEESPGGSTDREEMFAPCCLKGTSPHVGNDVQYEDDPDCISIARLAPRVHTQMRSEVFQALRFHGLDGVRVIAEVDAGAVTASSSGSAAVGSQLHLRYLRDCLVERGGVVSHIDVVAADTNANTLTEESMLEACLEAGLPNSSFSIHSRWSAASKIVGKNRKNRREIRQNSYRVMVKRHLHFRIAASIVFLQPGFDVLVTHMYFQRLNASLISNGTSTVVCRTILLNVVGEHLSSQRQVLHQPRGHRPLAHEYILENGVSHPTVWSEAHRSFFHQLVSRQRYLDVYNFGLQRTDCFGPEEWPGLALFTDADPDVLSPFFADPEEILTRSFSHWMSRGSTTACPCVYGMALAAVRATPQQVRDIQNLKERFAGMDSVMQADVRVEHVLQTVQDHYAAVAHHVAGTKQCCLSSSCLLFGSSASSMEHKKPYETPCLQHDNENCTWPFSSSLSKQVGYGNLRRRAIPEPHWPEHGQQYSIVGSCDARSPQRESSGKAELLGARRNGGDLVALFASPARREVVGMQVLCSSWRLFLVNETFQTRTREFAGDAKRRSLLLRLQCVAEGPRTRGSQLWASGKCRDLLGDCPIIIGSIVSNSSAESFPSATVFRLWRRSIRGFVLQRIGQNGEGGAFLPHWGTGRLAPFSYRTSLPSCSASISFENVAVSDASVGTSIGYNFSNSSSTPKLMLRSVDLNCYIVPRNDSTVRCSTLPPSNNYSSVFELLKILNGEFSFYNRYFECFLSARTYGEGVRCIGEQYEKPNPVEHCEEFVIVPIVQPRNSKLSLTTTVRLLSRIFQRYVGVQSVSQEVEVLLSSKVLDGADPPAWSQSSFDMHFIGL